MRFRLHLSDPEGTLGKRRGLVQFSEDQKISKDDSAAARQFLRESGSGVHFSRNEIQTIPWTEFTAFREYFEYIIGEFLGFRLLTAPNPSSWTGSTKLTDP
jgi:hypothetical protein